MPSSLFDLSGRIALITGAAQGLGRAIALAVAEAGADVLLVDRNADGAAKTAAELEQLGRRGVPHSCDVSDPTQVRAMFALLDREFGRIDFLANVAGDALM